MGAQSERRGGQYGNKRGKTVQQQQAARAADKRAQDALARARDFSAQLDRIAEQQHAESAAEIAQREAAEAAEAKQRAYEARQAAEARNAELRKKWPLGDARMMLRQGYKIEVVMKRTGWSYNDLSDLAGRDGRGINEMVG